MDEDLAYYRGRADDHRGRAARAASETARIAHLALADAYERRCTPSREVSFPPSYRGAAAQHP